jgi:ribose 5-phosphate isomerase B
MKNKIAIASDHAGFELKEIIKIHLNFLGYEYEDYGTYDEKSVDYPDIIHPMASAINKNKYETGIIMCGSGNGVAITANKYLNVRAAICWTREVAKFARLHNDANIVSLPARFIDADTAKEIVTVFLTTAFEGGRHLRRVNKIKNIIS